MGHYTWSTWYFGNSGILSWTCRFFSITSNGHCNRHSLQSYQNRRGGEGRHQQQGILPNSRAPKMSKINPTGG